MLLFLLPRDNNSTKLSAQVKSERRLICDPADRSEKDISSPLFAADGPNGPSTAGSILVETFFFPESRMITLEEEKTLRK